MPLTIKNKTLCVKLLVSLALLPAINVSASITVNLEAPDWLFLLKNEPWAGTEAKLAAGERNFTRKIQPLLAEGDHQGIIKAFENRDIKDDGAALRLLRGQVLLSLKQYRQAQKALLAALEIKPNLALAHRSISMVYMVEKKYAQAKVHLTRTIELGVGDAQAYGQLAYVNLQLHQAASAVSGYQYALFLESDNKQWQQGLLYALIQSQALDQAQALVDELLESDADNADLWLQRGQIALRQERTSQAISSLEAALALGVKDAENIAFSAQLHIQSGSPRRAVELLSDHSEALLKAGKIDVLEQIAAWLVFEQKWQQLDRLISAINVKKTKLPAAYRSRFYMYQAKILLANNTEKSTRLSAKKLSQRKNDAKKHLKHAISADPSNGEALLALAYLLRESNLNEKALIYFTRAEALPEYTERALLGRSQWALDFQHYDEALRLLRKVIAYNPNRSDVLDNIKALERLVRSQS